MSVSTSIPPKDSASVLVVEEDDGVRRLLELWLQHLGCPVWVAAGGREALDLLRIQQGSIQLVLLDVGMSGWDGPTTLKALRTITPSLHCCFMTGNGGTLSLEELLALGVDRLIHKPFALEEITQVLRDTGLLPERRTALRCSAGPAKVAVRQTDLDEVWDSWVLDRSVSGLGLVLPRPVVRGAVLSVTGSTELLDADTQLEVRHCRPVKDGWFVGGRLLGQSV